VRNEPIGLIGEREQDRGFVAVGGAKLGGSPWVWQANPSRSR
jgi:hypothetical protein